uniref:4Fe-4S dicluster domain-containing protein n=1 Tax=Thermodesulfobacterium geofontis TaxID=1295609 RepID=A0A7V4N4S3_9BACT
MARYRIFQNHNRCIGCFACIVHCKINKELGPGPKLCNIIPKEIKIEDGRVIQRFVFMTCFHCKDPECMKVCPTGAIQKREKDGIVFINSDLCTGCKECITACPWGIPQFNPETGKVVKCDYCKDRIDQGLLPACVSKCTTHALKWELIKKKPKKRQLN